MDLPIGSISHATLRSQDLAQAILDEWGIALDDSLISDLEHIAHDKRIEDTSTDSEVINDAIDCANEWAPAFCYAGMHIGDSSDLGIWPDFDAIEESEEVIKISDLSELDAMSPCESSAEYALHVNDHGNATLYRLTLGGPVELWAIV